MLWVHLTVLAVMACCGAGLIPGVLPVCCIILCATTALGLGQPNERQRTLFWLTAAWLLVTCLTLIPLPGLLVGQRRDNSFDQVEMAANLFRKAAFPARTAETEQAGSRFKVVRRLSLNAPGTVRYLFLFGSAWALFWGVATSSLRRRLRFARNVVLLGGAVAAAAIAGRYIWPQEDWLLWWYPVPETATTNALGPFINRNHFATFAGMLAPVAFGLLLPTWRDPERRARISPRGPAGRALWLVLMLLLASSVFLSLSRGGIAALLVGIGVTTLYWLRADRRIATVAACVGIGAFIAVALWPDQALQKRFQTLRQQDTPDIARLNIWRQSIKLWQRYPIWGCGYNAYHTALIPDEPLPLGKTATHSESDYLQTLAEGGVVSVAFALAVAVLGLRAACRTIRATRTQAVDDPHRHPPDGVDAEEDAPVRESAPSRRQRALLPDNLVSGALGALAALAVHSLVDVPLRVPLDACVAAGIFGLLMPLRQYRTAFPSWPDEALPERLFIGGVAVLAAVAVWSRPGWDRLYGDTLRAESADHPAELVHALGQSPDYWYLWALLSRRLRDYADGADSSAERTAFRQVALFALERAAEANPTSPVLRGELAARLWEEGDLAKAREAYWQLFELQPDDPSVWTDWMQVEWKTGHHEQARKIAGEGAPLLPTPQQQLALWRTLASLEATRGSVQRMLDALQMGASAMPGDAEIHWSVAICQRELGYLEAEANTLRKITELNPEDWRAWWRLAHIHAQTKRPAPLNRALQKAVSLNPKLRSAAADLWETLADD